MRRYVEQLGYPIDMTDDSYLVLVVALAYHGIIVQAVSVAYIRLQQQGAVRFCRNLE
jgi:hypothetical protein